MTEINYNYKLDENSLLNYEGLLEKSDETKLTAVEIAALRSIQEKLHSSAVKAGWHKKPREAGTDCALIHSEVSEAMEGFRKDLNDDHLPHRKMAEVEMADAVIRIMDTCGKYGFDLAGAMAEKFAYNQVRPDHKLENREKEGGKKF